MTKAHGSYSKHQEQSSYGTLANGREIIKPKLEKQIARSKPRWCVFFWRYLQALPLTLFQAKASVRWKTEKWKNRQEMIKMLSIWFMSCGSSNGFCTIYLVFCTWLMQQDCVIYVCASAPFLLCVVEYGRMFALSSISTCESQNVFSIHMLTEPCFHSATLYFADSHSLFRYYNARKV